MADTHRREMKVLIKDVHRLFAVIIKRIEETINLQRKLVRSLKKQLKSNGH